MAMLYLIMLSFFFLLLLWAGEKVVSVFLYYFSDQD